MATLTVTLPTGTTVVNGKQITFRAPCDCTGISGIVINGTTYTLVDATTEQITGHTFKKDAMVSVIMDTENNKAFVQNGIIYGVSSVELTKAEYDALASAGALDSNTFYIIKDEVDSSLTAADIPVSTQTATDLGLSSGASIDTALRSVSVNGVHTKAGSYTGKGGAGSNQAVTLTFDFKPNALFLANSNHKRSSHMIRGQKIADIPDADQSINVTWGNNYVSWYSSVSWAQYDSSGDTYYYFAIG